MVLKGLSPRFYKDANSVGRKNACSMDNSNEDNSNEFCDSSSSSCYCNGLLDVEIAIN